MNPSLTGVDYLMAMPQYGLGSTVAIRPGLDRIRALLRGMGNPERGLPVIHVAGTNGKGSTASWIAAILTAHGLRVGLHTSPHLLQPGERMRVDGRAASREWLGKQIDRYVPLIEETGASYFEVTVAMSLLRFAEADVDVAVVEVGLGGRLDATNILDPDVCVITTVGLDHTHILGDSLAAIAAEKAGIIKDRVPVVVGRQPPEALTVLMGEAARHGASVTGVREARWSGRTLQTPTRRYTHVYPALAGSHQLDNAATAVLAAEAYLDEMGRSVDARAVRRGLRHVQALAGLRARFEVLEKEPLVVLDVAHNPPALAAAVERFTEMMNGRRPEVLLAVMSDKDIDTIADLLATQGDTTHDLLIHPLRLDSPRALAPEDLAARLSKVGVDVGTPQAPDQLPDFLASLGPRRAVLATGSHQVVAAVLNAWPGQRP
ncbi:MAG: bifunctional folylpolyglutamate synthase/dihydrofolate synthase [Rhodothermales bacterium]|nr:bifunctional folylpolyglutamate synthase/dihydrofolate synthase [Rhodothermales bacterium]